jgi:hypothetical protein
MFRRIGGASVLALVLAVGCSVKHVESDVSDTLGIGCEEFAKSGEIDARVDAKVKVFMEASRDFVKISGDFKAGVRDACANMARDLGGEDSWSKLGDGDDSVTNQQGTGACDVASVRIKAIMEAHVDANFALTVTPGECHHDFEAQAACEQQCKADAVCDSGTCETRCEPAQLSVKCEGSCKLNAQCEGNAKVDCNCMGKCESTCTGECKGTCTSPDGKKTENDPNCHGKCSSSCNGKCRGICKIQAEEGIQCGANVRCTGGCEGQYEEPKCTTTFTPPKCTVDQTCLDSCSAKAEANLICEPTTVELYANVSVHADVQKLVTTVNANMSKLVQCSEAEGKVAVTALDRLSASGDALVKGKLVLNPKTVSCAGAATKQAGNSAASLKATTIAARNVTDTCRSHAD